MRLAGILFLSLFIGAVADAQTIPVGVGVIATNEKLKVGGGCDSFSGGESIAFVIFANGTWLTETESGIYGGSLTSADTKGRSWNLHFDAESLALYTSYLEVSASILCGTEVAILGGNIESFVVKFGKNWTQVSLQLKTSATGVTIFGSGKGKHSIKGKGAFAPGF